MSDPGDGTSPRWANKVDFFMAAISSTVGLGNLWRFPYVCYRNGGGAFLIPFMLMTVLIGFPLVTMDLTLGQFGRRGPVGVWNLCPLFEGIGWSMLAMSAVCTTYYVMLMAYSLYYIFASFSSTLPWTSCSNPWNTEHCIDAAKTCTLSGRLWANDTCTEESTLVSYPTQTNSTQHRFPSEEYFYNYVLGLSSGISDLGGVQWPLALCLLLAWCFIILGLSLGTRSWGKLSYVTALLPYVVMLALLIQACLMPGSKDGILYFIRPDWTRLASAWVWVDAAVQVFFSVGCGWGNFITIGKHNRFNDNPIRDAVILVLGDVFTSVFCGFVIFSVLGQMAHQAGVDVTSVVYSGPGLAFIIYPRAVTTMPLPQLWAVLFFLMLVNLGLGSAIPQLANILVSLTETFSTLSSKRNRLFTLLGLGGGSFLIGLIYTTRGGMYVLTLADTYGPPLCLLVLGLSEVLVVAWIYGSRQLLQDLSLMTGWRRCYIFIAFWNILSPASIIAVIVLFLKTWKNVCLEEYCFPGWAHVIGWILTTAQLIIIPVIAIYKLVTVRGLREIPKLLRPTKEWGAEAVDSITIKPPIGISKV